MKHQVFFLFFVCASSLFSMENRSTFLKERCSEQDNLFLMVTLTRYGSRAAFHGFVPNKQALAMHILDMQHSSMTKREHYWALLKIWDRDIVLIDEERKVQKELDKWGLVGYESTRKRREIN